MIHVCGPAGAQQFRALAEALPEHQKGRYHPYAYLDEEMIELMKIQRAHEAASKLVTIADEMLQTLLSMR